MTSLGQIGNSPKRLNRASIQAHPSFGLLEYLIKTNSRDSLIAMSTKETCSNTAEHWPMSDHHGRSQLDSWVFPGMPNKFGNTLDIYQHHTCIYIFYII